MKFATKMSLVPVEDEEKETEMLSELDNELSNILKNKELNEDDKLKLYNSLLISYQVQEEKINLNSEASNMSQEQPASGTEHEIKEIKTKQIKPKKPRKQKIQKLESKLTNKIDKPKFSSKWPSLF